MVPNPVNDDRGLPVADLVQPRANELEALRSEIDDQRRERYASGEPGFDLMSVSRLDLADIGCRPQRGHVGRHDLVADRIHRPRERDPDAKSHTQGASERRQHPRLCPGRPLVQRGRGMSDRRLYAVTQGFRRPVRGRAGANQRRKGLPLGAYSRACRAPGHMGFEITGRGSVQLAVVERVKKAAAMGAVHFESRVRCSSFRRL